MQNRLKDLRERSGMTQTEVAERLHVSLSAYNYYEAGKRRPSYETLVQLAQIYDVSTDYLLGRSDLPAVPPILTGEELNMLNDFRSLDQRGRRAVQNLLFCERSSSQLQKNI